MLKIDPTANRTRVYCFGTRRSIHYNIGRLYHIPKMTSLMMVFLFLGDNFASLLYNHSIFIFRRYVLREPKQTYTAEITSAIEEYP